MGKIKLSDYVVRFLRNKGITHVFAIQGGCSVHLIDSIARCEGIEYVCNQHEQASAMAADGYARLSGGLGCAIATSGPGATNLLTGCCSAYFDSVPVMFITGQVNSYRLRGKLGIRQMGFQETDVVGVFSPVTKYAARLQRPEDIGYELEKAACIAMEGRKGPVLLDIPLDFQYAMVDEAELGFFEQQAIAGQGLDADTLSHIVHLLKNAKRPLLIGGWGIHLAKAEDEFRSLVERLKIPVILTWGANDILEDDNKYRVGSMGINGSRYGNITVQEADLLLVIGARLDTHTAGAPQHALAPYAKKIVVDIDANELSKFKSLGVEVDVTVNMDAKTFVGTLLKVLSRDCQDSSCSWRRIISKWKERYPSYLPNRTEGGVNPYAFVRELSFYASEGTPIFCDTGSSLVWMNQAFSFKRGQRLFSAFNNTPMGYSLPAAIGAAFWHNGQIICIAGDGGLQMNLQELATVVRHNLPIKIILFVNNGYGMIQRTQDTYHKSRYEASDIKSGLAFPDFAKLFSVYGFKVAEVGADGEMAEVLHKVFAWKGPACCLVRVSIAFPFLAGSPQQMLPLRQYSKR